jgi:biotin operon repressor
MHWTRVQTRRALNASALILVRHRPNDAAMDATSSFFDMPWSTVPAEQAARPDLQFERKIGGTVISGVGPEDWIDALEASLARREDGQRPPEEPNPAQHEIAIEIRALLSTPTIGVVAGALEPALRARHLLRVGGDPSDRNRWEAIRVVTSVCKFFSDLLQQTGKNYFTVRPPSHASVMDHFGDWGDYVWRMWPCAAHLYLVEACYDVWDPSTLADYYPAMDSLWEEAAALLLLQHPGQLLSATLTRELRTVLSGPARRRQCHVDELLSEVQEALLHQRYVSRPLAARRQPNRSLDDTVRYFLRTVMHIASDLPDKTGIPRSTRRRIRRRHGPESDVARIRDAGMKKQQHRSDAFQRAGEIAQTLGVSKSTMMNHLRRLQREGHQLEKDDIGWRIRGATAHLLSQRLAHLSNRESTDLSRRELAATLGVSDKRVGAAVKRIAEKHGITRHVGPVPESWVKDVARLLGILKPRN